MSQPRLVFANHVRATEMLSAFRLPDFFWTPQYGVASMSQWQKDHGVVWESAFWFAGEEEEARARRPVFYFPYLVRFHTDRSVYDVSSVYGYTGVCVLGNVEQAADKDRQLCLFREEWIKQSRQRGCVSEFLRFSPVVDSFALTLPHVDKFVLQTSTIILDVTRPYDEWLMKDCHGKNRSSMRAGLRKGLKAELRKATPADVSQGSPFLSLYTDTMDRIGASEGYYFLNELYLYLVQDLETMVCVVRDAEGEPVAAGLFVVWDDILHYHLAGSAKARKDLVGVNNVMLHKVVEWACEEDRITRFHLGGGTSDSQENSLFKFKRSFGGTVHQFWSGRTVVWPEKYQGLVEQRARELRVEPSALEESGFFPAFRATVKKEEEGRG